MRKGIKDEVVGGESGLQGRRKGEGKGGGGGRSWRREGEERGGEMGGGGVEGGRRIAAIFY